MKVEVTMFHDMNAYIQGLYLATLVQIVNTLLLGEATTPRTTIEK
mgnify:FL=1